MTTDEMKRCIDEIIRLGNVMRELNDLDERAVAHPPPTRTALERYAQQAGADAPPSFLRLLALHDGIACFDYVDVDLYPMAYLLENARMLEEEWVDAGKFKAGDIYVFGRSDSDSLAVAFLRTKRRPDGEMPVVKFDARGVLAEHESLVDYLQARLESFRRQVNREQADRAGLRDDE